MNTIKLHLFDIGLFKITCSLTLQPFPNNWLYILLICMEFKSQLYVHALKIMFY